MMKRASALVLAAGLIVGSYATDARVSVMGRQSHPWFYRDEVTVFVNPADMGLYPNLLYGSFGTVDGANAGGWASEFGDTPLLDPFFGGIFSFGTGGGDEDGGPMFSIGAFANRRDPILSRILTAGGGAADLDNPDFGLLNNLAEPLGKFDLMFGYDLGNGLKFGLGFYTALQSQKHQDVVLHQTEFYKGSLGFNWSIDQGLDVEAAVNVGISSISYAGSVIPDQDETTVTDGNLFLRGDLRFFSAIPAINGAFVPQVTLEYISFNEIVDVGAVTGPREREVTAIDLTGGAGLNVNIDRGFFFGGLQVLYTSESGGNEDYTSVGARLSFGVERNIVWDWFMIRVGGQKEFRHVTSGDASFFAENAISDGSDNDLVGLGFGVNIDQRLRIDVVTSESLPYTFTNLISGNISHLFNRVSATYRF
jgi:hypothetical protein